MAGHAVFINYRRDDTADACGRIYDRLAREFGQKTVFKDVDALPVGQDFGKYIVETLQKCRVLLAIIGPAWLEARDETGNRRLDNPQDWVRLEIETAARMPDVQIVPVLVNGARMPSPGELPESLQLVTNLNAAIVRRDPDFHGDMDRLISALKEGALTGFVEVETPTSGPGAATAHWEQLKNSDDPGRLTSFAESFPGTTEAFHARERAKQIRERMKADKEFEQLNNYDLTAMRVFLERHPNHPKREVVQQRIDETERLISEANNKRQREAEREEKAAREHQQKTDRKRRDHETLTTTSAWLIRFANYTAPFALTWFVWTIVLRLMFSDPQARAILPDVTPWTVWTYYSNHVNGSDGETTYAIMVLASLAGAFWVIRKITDMLRYTLWGAVVAAAMIVLAWTGALGVSLGSGASTQAIVDFPSADQSVVVAETETPDRLTDDHEEQAPGAGQVDEAPGAATRNFEEARPTSEDETLSGAAALPNLIEGSAFATVHITALTDDRFQLSLHTPAGEETFDLEGRRWRLEATLERGIFRLVRISTTGRNGARARIELSERYSWPTAEDDDPIIHQLYQTVRDGASYSLVYDRILHAERTFDTQ